MKTCMLYAYDTVTLSNGYVTVRLNAKKAKRIKRNQKIRDFFRSILRPISRPEKEEVLDIHDPDVILL